MPRLFTMATFHDWLWSLLPETPPLHTLSVHEAQLLLTEALASAGERFRPARITAERIIRWKQELLNPTVVEQLFPFHDLPGELRDLPRVIRVWKEYEQRKGTVLLDRGDVATTLVDTLARADHIPEHKVLVLCTHGLSHTDSMMLHLLTRNRWHVGISFAPHPAPNNASQRSRQWFVAHGWSDTEGEAWSDPQVSVFPMPTQREEVRRVLGAIKECVASGVEPSNIAVIYPDNSSYAALLSEYSDCGVPLCHAMELYASTLLDAQALYGLAWFHANGWQRADLEHLLRLHVVSESSPLFALANSASAYRIEGGNGADEWLQRLRDGSADGEAAAKRVITVHNAFRGLTADRLSAVQFEQGLLACANALGITPTSVVGETLSAYTATAQRLGMQPASLRDHVRAWWAIVKRTSLRNVAPRWNGVAVISPIEARCQRFAVVFALGMADGVVPILRTDALEEALTGRTHLQMGEEIWADIQSAGAVVYATYPEVLQESPAMMSQFLLSAEHTKNAPEALWNTATTLILTEEDQAAYVGMEAVQVRRTQSGPDMNTLTPTATAYVQSIQTRPLHPSALDLVARCPYKYFTRYVLNVSDEDDTTEQLTARERGTLMHEVARRFFNEVRGGELHQFTSVEDVRSAQVDLLSRTVDEWMPLLINVYERERQAYPRNYLYDAAEEYQMLDTPQRAGLLRRWLSMEYQLQTASAFRPLVFEVEYSGTVPIGTALEPVRLFMDRLDVCVTDGVVQVVVVDYKLSHGSVPSVRSVLDATATQPLLYVLAAHEWFTLQNIPVQVVGMRYHTFGKEVKADADPKWLMRVPFKKTSSPDSSVYSEVRVLAEQTEPLVQRIRSGMYAVKPNMNECSRCAYGELCRVEDWGMCVE